MAVFFDYPNMMQQLLKSIRAGTGNKKSPIIALLVIAMKKITHNWNFYRFIFVELRERKKYLKCQLFSSGISFWNNNQELVDIPYFWSY